MSPSLCAETIVGVTSAKQILVMLLFMFLDPLRPHLFTNLSFNTSSFLWKTLSSPTLRLKKFPAEGELFILWATLNRFCNNIAFHIVTQLDEQAKHNKAVIAAGGIVTALAHRLGLQTFFLLCLTS